MPKSNIRESFKPIIAETNRLNERFFIVNSCEYGLTVYDRATTSPAFSFGAKAHMSEFNALFLYCFLNKKEKERRLISLIEATVSRLGG